MTSGKTRLCAIDAARGAALISMIIYHFCRDLSSFGMLPVNMTLSPACIVWQRSICFTFILVSGFCFPMSGRPVKNGIILLLWGGVITAVTALFFPRDKIVFGILTFMGCAAILTALFGPIFKKISPAFGLISALVLFAVTYNINKGYILSFPLPTRLYANYITAFFGFPFNGFFSADYFSLLPWYFLYLVGYFAYGIMKNRGLLRILKKPNVPVVGFLGRHSLIIYILHQPIIYPSLLLIGRLLGGA